MTLENILTLAGILEVVVLAFVGYLMSRISNLEGKIEVLNNNYIENVTALNLKMDNIEKYIHEQKHNNASKDAQLAMLTQTVLNELTAIKTKLP